MQDLVIYLAQTFPWYLRTAVGLWLPLMTACYCLWTQRGRLNSPVGMVGVLASIAIGRIMWETVKLQVVQVGDHTFKGVAFSVHFAVWVAMLVCAAAFVAGNRRVDKRAVFAGVFFPLLVVDLFSTLKVFPGDWSKLYVAVGGAGPVDALFIAPVFAVASSCLVEWELKNFTRINAWCKAQILRLLPGR